MQDREWTFEDKSGWGEGPWQNEPDKVQFTDLKTGLPCLIVRSGMSGALCGYVGVSSSHPFFERDYSEIDSHVNVHGGLTYANFCQPGEPEHGICHVVDDGEDGHVWWLGFDCGHAFDYTPGFEARMKDAVPEWPLKEFGRANPMVSYKSIEYVKHEIAELAEQLASRG